HSRPARRLNFSSLEPATCEQPPFCASGFAITSLRCILTLNLYGFFAFPEMSTSAKTRIAQARVVGTPAPRKEGIDKLLGRACYLDDMQREGLWHGATVRSTVPRGLIRT